MLQAIVCIGETLEQRESGELWNVLQGQLDAVADKLSKEDWDGVVIAYEPVRSLATLDKWIAASCCLSASWKTIEGIMAGRSYA